MEHGETRQVNARTVIRDRRFHPSGSFDVFFFGFLLFVRSFAGVADSTECLAGHRLLLDDNRLSTSAVLHLPCHGRSRFLFNGAVAAPDVEAPVSEATRVVGTRLQLDLAAYMATDTDGEHHVQATPTARTAQPERLGIFTDTARRAEALATPSAAIKVICDRRVHDVLRRRARLHDDRRRRGNWGLHRLSLRVLRLLLGGLLTVILGLRLSSHFCSRRWA